MQFTGPFEAGDSFCKFHIDYTKLKYEVNRSIWNTFEKLGGKAMLGQTWIFPSFITCDVIQEIIHNTCFVCGGLMQDGQALKVSQLKVNSEWGGVFYDNPEDSKIIKVRKCQSCGHSHT